MEEKIKQLYDLMYSPIITPYNLLENAKLDNYAYVNYTKSNGGLLVTMKCTIEPDFVATFFYYFDAQDKLQRAVMESDEGTEVIFSRETELARVKTIISKELDEPFKQFAI